MYSLFLNKMFVIIHISIELEIILLSYFNTILYMWVLSLWLDHKNKKSTSFGEQMIHYQ